MTNKQPTTKGGATMATYGHEGGAAFNSDQREALKDAAAMVQRAAREVCDKILDDAFGESIAADCDFSAADIAGMKEVGRALFEKGFCAGVAFARKASFGN